MHACETLPRANTVGGQNQFSSFGEHADVLEYYPYTATPRILDDLRSTFRLATAEYTQRIIALQASWL